MAGTTRSSARADKGQHPQAARQYEGCGALDCAGRRHLQRVYQCVRTVAASTWKLQLLQVLWQTGVVPGVMTFHVSTRAGGQEPSSTDDAAVGTGDELPWASCRASSPTTRPSARVGTDQQAQGSCQCYWRCETKALLTDCSFGVLRRGVVERRCDSGRGKRRALEQVP